MVARPRSTSDPMQLEELNMENSRLVNPEMERLQGVVDGLKAEVNRVIFHARRTASSQEKWLCRQLDGESGS